MLRRDAWQARQPRRVESRLTNANPSQALFPTVALVPVAAALACAAAILTLMRHPDWLPVDRPNERSLHTTPRPRVGGLGIVVGLLLAFLLLRADALLPTLVAALAAVSYFDDRHHVPIVFRFLAHGVAAAAFTLLALPDIGPAWRIGTVIAVVWLTNLYNFMDGSDGLAGGMTLFGFTAYALGAWAAGDLILATLAASVAAAAAAFLAFNFPPARVFMGDAGSIPIGFLAATFGLIGWSGQLWPLSFPLLVFSPFLVDATVTLLRRIARGERFWEAHKTHYYQRLVQLGWGHRDTALAGYLLMALCGAAALWTLELPLRAQLAVCGGIALLYLAIGIAIDRAWGRYLNTVRIDASAR